MKSSKPLLFSVVIAAMLAGAACLWSSSEEEAALEQVAESPAAAPEGMAGDERVTLKDVKAPPRGDSARDTNDEAPAPTNNPRVDQPECAVAPGKTLTGIDVLFQLDPRLTRGMYMGERWISAPTMTAVQNGETVTVSVKAQGHDAKNQPVAITPTWTSSTPAIANVVPPYAANAVITAAREGDSVVVVQCGAMTAELHVKVRDVNGVLQAEVSR